MLNARVYIYVFSMCLFITHSSTVIASDIDWNNIEGKDISLFYPGQASWEWALTQSSHSGARKFREGKNCRDCHEGEQEEMGNLILSGEKLEPSPFPYKNGFVSINVKTAHDGDNIYLRLEWPDVELTGSNILDDDFESKVNVIIDDGSLREPARAGCWGICHDDANTMTSSHASLDIEKYTSGSRVRITRQGGGLNFKPQDELDALYEQGVFLEYWQAGLNKGAQAVVSDGLILKQRDEYENSLVQVDSKFDSADGGRWIVEFSRELTPSEDGRKSFVPGEAYNLGFALHGGHASKRFHYVSFGYTLSLDRGTADFITLN